MGQEVQKNHRQRKRHHYNAIRAQMEFYFGDANLSKDRFLKQAITEDPYVPLDVFLKFNKIKELTTCTKDIAKALSNSQLLELDEAQLKVRRKTTLPVDRNMDANTLYVESLPVTADHDWVRQVFERFGPVTYVSLPRYAKSRKIKEFAFVEFEQEGSVARAVAAFKDLNGVLSMECTNPAELTSVKSYLIEQKSETESAISYSDSQKTLKRKPVQSDEEEPQQKKAKTDSEYENSSTTGAEEDTTTAAESADDCTDSKTSSKKKRRKKKKKHIDKYKKNPEQSTDLSLYDLKVLPKRDWKRLRNKYLNLQREKVSQLKRKAREQQLAHRHAQELASEVHELGTLPPPVKKPKATERKLQKMNMNFYGAGEDDTQTKSTAKEIKHNPALERAPLFSFQAGLIVEVGFLEPCTNVKEFKNDMRQYKAVRYVDIKEGALHAHLRLDSPLAAENFVRHVNSAEYQCKLLTGDAENDYWKKIERDREVKLNKNVKIPQKRGREKVKKLIAKHIHFGDDDE